MRRVIFFVVVFLSSALLFTKSVAASDDWKKYPQNSCPPYPSISACNLNYIAEINLIQLKQIVNSSSGFVGNAIAFTFQNPPVSTKEYIGYMQNRFHVPGTPTTAYAANDGGFGFNALGPVIKIWVAMRNLAYFAFSVIFIIIGIMILIRSKIDPKTTINIQNALPKIVIALILVTFSYAIAGFLIDFMYVVLGLVVTILSSVEMNVVYPNTPVGIDQLSKSILKNNIFWAILNSDYMLSAIGDASQSIAMLITTFVSGVGSQGITDTPASFIGGLAGGIAFLIIAIAVLIALFKTWLSLLSAYANIILDIILSPLKFMLDAIPGQSNFSGWIRGMLANLMAFPAVMFMLLIGIILAKTNENNPGSVTGAINGFAPPLIGAANQQAMQALLGIAIILTIPKTVEIIQEAIKIPKNKFGNAWGEQIGGGVQMAQQGKKFAEDQSGVTAAKASWQKKRGDEMAAVSTGQEVGGLRGFLMRN